MDERAGSTHSASAMRSLGWKKIKILAGILTAKRAFTGPYFVRISLTDACNYSCIMCANHSPLLASIRPTDGRELQKWGQTREGEKRVYLDVELAKKLIDELVQMEVNHVLFTAFGEPFMHPGLMDMIRYTSSKGIRTGVISNGALIDQNRAKALLESGLHHLNISLNSASRETFREIHQRPPVRDFDSICQTIRFLAEHRNPGQLRLGVSNVICSMNVHEAEDMARLAIELGVDDLTFIRVIVFEQIQHLSLSAEQRSLMEQSVPKVKSILSSSGVNTNIDRIDWGSEKLNRSGGLYSQISCYIGWVLSLISANGNVYPCCGCSRIMGNIKEKSFQEIWTASKYGLFRQQAKSLVNRRSEVPSCRCYNCDHWESIPIHNHLHPFGKVDLYF